MTNTSAVADGGPAPAVSPRGRFFFDQTFHFETLRNAGYIVSNCAELGEVLETVKVIAEGDVQTDFEEALVNARSVTTRVFDRRSGGAGHCQGGALTLYHAAVFDWLLDKFAVTPRGQ